MLIALALAGWTSIAPGRSVAAQAADPSELTNVAYGNLRFSYPNWLASGLVIARRPGDPVADGPGFADAPHLSIELYDPYPAEGEYDLRGSIRLYSLADLAKYDYLQAQVTKLQKLLKDRASLKPFEEVDMKKPTESLPQVPLLTHGQIIRARAQYVETESIAGISYLAVTRADLAPLTTYDVYYTFQGLSKDGKTYVSVTLPFSTTLFPAKLDSVDLPAFEKEAQAYFTDAVAKLNAATSNQFRPSMDIIENISRSIAFVK